VILQPGSTILPQMLYPQGGHHKLREMLRLGPHRRLCYHLQVEFWGFKPYLSSGGSNPT